jgi:hypothetical protein
MNDLLQLLWTQAWQIAVLAICVAIFVRTVRKEPPASGSCDVAAGAHQVCNAADLGTFAGAV